MFLIYCLRANCWSIQIESAGMREAQSNKPNHIEDIIALVALYRPGPMSNIPTYNDCKHGRQTPDYLHHY